MNIDFEYLMRHKKLKHLRFDGVNLTLECDLSREVPELPRNLRGLYEALKRVKNYSEDIK